MDVRLSRHAVERYRDRLRPALSLPAAKRELQRLASTQGVLVSERPEWCCSDHGRGGFLLLGDDVCLPVALDAGRVALALTCLVRGDLPEGERRRRNRRRAERRRRPFKRREPRPSRWREQEPVL